MKSFCAVFLAAFALYAATLHPALAPYRDAGEMSVAASTLSVAHPTSYPLYVQLGHMADMVPLGNRAYRLGLLSALGAALAVALAFWLARRRFGAAAGAAAALLLALNSTFWSVAQVQEMYALNALLALALLGLAWRLGRAYDERTWLFFALAYGLFLGNRLDLLLWAPGLIWLALASGLKARHAAYWAGACLLIFPVLMVGLGSNFPIVALVVGTALWLCPDRGRRPRWTALSAAFAALGLAVYLFLPVRSATRPFLDWNHPAVLANFMESLLRSRYGGTLDLLSTNYAKGELFADNLAFYARHLWDNFSAAGLALALAGCVLALRRRPRGWLGEAAAWWWSGPVFLFMANLPPNPHAAAIVEPHYLLSDLILAFWAAEAVGVAAERFRPGRAAAWALCALLAIVPLWRGRAARMDRRWHLFSYDYARNVMLSAPPGSTLAAKKDVQLYTLWHYQRVQGWRPDLRLIAQGLAGSPWYQADWRRRGDVYVGPLRDAQGWRTLAKLDAPFFATMDSEVPSELAAAARGRGLLYSWNDEAPAVNDGLWALVARRGRYEYEGQPDFFTSDIVGNYAQARYQAGRDLYAAGAAQAAEDAFRQAWAWQWNFPEPANFLGYMFFVKGDYAAAGRYYSWAGRFGERTLELAERYRSLPDLKAAVRRSAADVFMQLGVVAEKAGAAAAAQGYYRRSLELAASAQVHYNLAVLFWSRDPARAGLELQEALRLDPNHPEARRYLAVLRARGSER
ncbi:MAG: DUF2723 domain-containing protein [Elusimicrobia bacterium]|nr:DUF2723 domain-containing protein [Elusimicrobiota bacterium]